MENRFQSFAFQVRNLRRWDEGLDPDEPMRETLNNPEMRWGWM